MNARPISAYAELTCNYNSPMQIDLVSQLVKNGSVPVVDPGLAASYQDDFGIYETNGVRPLARLCRVRGSRLLADLPFAPHLVAEAPILHSVCFVAPRVLAAQVRVVAVLLVSTGLSSRRLGSEAHVSPVPLQYSIQWSASSSAPVPMLSTMYGSIFAARHHALNLRSNIVRSQAIIYH